MMPAGYYGDIYVVKILMYFHIYIHLCAVAFARESSKLLFRQC